MTNFKSQTNLKFQVPSTKIHKSQNTKHKYQINHNDQNSRTQLDLSIRHDFCNIFVGHDTAMNLRKHPAIS